MLKNLVFFAIVLFLLFQVSKIFWRHRSSFRRSSCLKNLETLKERIEQVCIRAEHKDVSLSTQRTCEKITQDFQSLVRGRTYLTAQICICQSFDALSLRLDELDLLIKKDIVSAKHSLPKGLRSRKRDILSTTS